MLKFVSNIMSGNTFNRLKSVIVVPKGVIKSKVINQKADFQHSQIRLANKAFSQLKQKFHKAADGHKNHKTAGHENHSKNKKHWPTYESLSRHADYRPLGLNDDWGPLSHLHELMPMDNVRYWHQHRCEVCEKLFEHKHKQRGNESMNYNKHICSVCGGTRGSRRVLSKNYQSSMDDRKNRY